MYVRPRETSASAVPSGDGRVALKEVGRINEAARRLRGRGRCSDRDALRAVGARIEQHDLAAAGVDDARAVGRRIAREVVALVGVALHVAAVRAGRVQVADPLVIGEEEDALADPHRPHQVAVELAADPRERSAAVAIDPQVPGGAAAVALPARRVEVVAAEHGRAVGSNVERHRVADRETAREAAVARDRERDRLLDERRAGVGGEVDLAAVVRPAGDVERVAAEEGQALRRPARCRDDVDLGTALIASDVGDERAIAREPRERADPRPGGEPARDPAARGYRPQIVLADEDDRLSGDRRHAVVPPVVHKEAGIGGRPEPSRRGARPVRRTSAW